MNDSAAVIDRPAVAPRQGLRLSRQHLLLSLGAVLLIVALAQPKPPCGPQAWPDTRLSCEGR